MLTKKQGFTLIELLVVIAIIAMLMAIIMPALKIAKDKAAVIVCMANQKGLVTAWHAYATENSDRIVIGYVGEDFMKSNGGPGSWVEPPQTEAGKYMGQQGLNIFHEYRENGYRKGLLFNGYLETVDVLHCPKDMRYKKGTPLGTSEAYQIYRTYSIPDGGTAIDDDYTEKLGYRTAKRASKMKSPSSKYIMVEEAYDGDSHNYNDASFNMSIAKSRLWDPLRIYHNNGTTIGFADAHVEYYKFQNQNTVDYFSDRAAYLDRCDNPPSISDGNEDVEFLLRCWPGEIIRKTGAGRN